MELITEPFFQIFIEYAFSFEHVLVPSNIIGENAGVRINCGNLMKMFLLSLTVHPRWTAFTRIDKMLGSRYTSKRYSGEINGSIDFV